MAGASFNHFPQIAARIKPAVQQIVKQTAQQVQGAAKSNAPYATGFLQSSIYVSDWEGSDYGQTGPPPGDSYLLPEVQPDNDTTAIVGVAANYGIYQEMGTRFMGAQPYFYPAVDEGQGFFDAELSTFEELIGSIG